MATKKVWTSSGVIECHVSDDLVSIPVKKESRFIQIVVGIIFIWGLVEAIQFVISLM